MSLDNMSLDYTTVLNMCSNTINSSNLPSIFTIFFSRSMDESLKCGVRRYGDIYYGHYADITLSLLQNQTLKTELSVNGGGLCECFASFNRTHNYIYTHVYTDTHIHSGCRCCTLPSRQHWRTLFLTTSTSSSSMPAVR